MPRAVAVARLDHQRADFDETVALCQRVFGDNVMPLYLPMLDDDGTSVAGLLGLITQRVFDYTKGYPPEVRDPDAEHLPAIEESRGELIEGIIAESEDETLMDRYLGGEDIATETLIDDLEKAVAKGNFYPVIPVCAVTGLGLDALLELLANAFPTPGEHDAARGHRPGRLAPRRARPATRTARWSPRWSRPPSTRTSAGSRCCGCSPAR